MVLQSAIGAIETSRRSMRQLWRRLGKRSRACLFAFACLPMLLSSCSVGAHHPNSSFLIETYWRHEGEFELLVRHLQDNAGLNAIDRASYRYHNRVFRVDATKPSWEGLSRAEWDWYQEKMKRLGIVRILKGNSEIELRVTEGALLNGDSTKGYLYSSRPQRNEKSSLDRYRISPEDKLRTGGYCALRRIATAWYLYLSVA